MVVVLLVAGTLLTAGAAALIANRVIISFRDPRFRNPNWLTRQAAESEIYTPRDIPRLVGVRELATRQLRLTLSRGTTARAWHLFRDGEDLGETRHADITFSDDCDGTGTTVGTLFRLEPRGGNAPTLQLRIFFYPQSSYQAAGLSWPNAYILQESNIAVSYPQCPGFSIQDWVGLHPRDPAIARARAAMEGEVDFAAPYLERQEALFLFLMRHISHLSHLPDDKLLNSSPWDTWVKMRDGQHGFCECKALIYYLFANAAGLPTRLIDLQGSIGAMVLTGHYLCETWLPNEQTWAMVDPHTRNLALVRDPEGRPLHTLALKKRYDLNHLGGCTIRQYDPVTATLVTRPLTDLSPDTMNWLCGPLIIGYKFGYPLNHNFSRLYTFLHRPTLLYSSLALPNPRRHLTTAIALIIAGLLLLTISLLLTT